RRTACAITWWVASGGVRERRICAAVPTPYNCSPVGSSTVGSFCSTTPIMRSLRTACCAAATDDFRPTTSGSTMPGNSTVWRTGRMTMASAGIESWPSPWACAALACCSACSAIMSRLPCQADEETPFHQRRSPQLPAGRRKGDAPLETALRNLEALDRHPARFGGEPAHAGNHQQVGPRGDFELPGFHTGKRDDD